MLGEHGCRWKAGLVVLALLLTACERQQTPPVESLYEHARLLLQLEQLPQASADTDRGLAIAPAGSKLAWQFHLLHAEILLAKREPKEASAALASPPPGDPNSTELMARYRLCQAHLALLLHDKAAARARLDQAQSLAETLRPSRLLAEIQLRRASLAIATGKSDAARQSLEHVLAYAALHNDTALRMSATGSMGYMLSQDDRCDEAIPWFEKTAALAKSLAARISEARAMGNVGYCLFELGDLGKALPDLRFAESRFASAGNRYERQIWLGNIGNIEEANREYDAAAADYAKALAISTDLGDNYWSALWLDNLASVSVERKDWNAADRFTDEALSRKQLAGDEKSRAYSFVNAGEIANGRGQYDQAIKTFESVLHGPKQDVMLGLEAHTGLAEAYAARHQDNAASAQFEAAIHAMDRQQSALLDEEHKLTWFSSVSRTYQHYVQFLLARGKTLEALEVVESSRGRVLTSRLGETDSRTRITAKDLRRIAARTASTLLVYFVAPSQSHAWVIEGAGIRDFQLPAEPELRKLVGSYLTFVQQLHDPLREQCAAGETLYDLLIAPAHPLNRTVMLAPDGPLYSLNFATLPVKGAATPHYWLEDVQVSVVPSFNLAPGRPLQGKRSLLLIGDPISAGPDFSELSFARQEISGIQQRLPGVRQLTYSRDQARPENYLHSSPNEFSWIHFVAHATANQEEPLQSAVILSPKPGAEYRLFAKDVVRIPLHADLVTISACRGAGAKVYAGEGLVGFSWAFLKSGARNVIAGLWDVNDRSTAELMTGLYGELGIGTSPAEALRTTQLAMSKSNGVFRKPYYWGPFEIFRASE